MTTYIRRLGKVSCVERTRRVIMLVLERLRWVFVYGEPKDGRAASKLFHVTLFVATVPWLRVSVCQSSCLFTPQDSTVPSQARSQSSAHGSWLTHINDANVVF